MKRFLTWLTLEPGERVVDVVSWMPWWGPYGVEWPAMRVDDSHGTRRRCVPVWDRVRISNLFKRRQA